MVSDYGLDAPGAVHAPLATHAEVGQCRGSRHVEEELGWGLAVASTEFRRWATEAVAEVPGGLRGYLILAAIAEGCPPSQLALAQSLGFDKSAMTSLLDGLERAQLLERRPDPADRRVRNLVITALGGEALSQARSRLDVAEQRLLAPLGGTEASEFRTMLGKVAHAALQGATLGAHCPL